jgi:hypothetical protein
MSKLLMELIGWVVLATSAWSLPTGEYLGALLGAMVIAASRHGS